MKYILDTNVVSELIERNQRLLEKLMHLDRNDVSVPQPVFAEIAYGIERLPKSRRKETLRESFTLVRTELKAVEWTNEVSDAFGEIKAKLERAGNRIEDFDAAIAAHALVQGAVLVTASVKHMARVPNLVIENWLVGE